MGILVGTVNPSIDQESIIGSLIDQELIATTKVFSHLCERIEKSITDQKKIKERNLLDFSRMAIIVFRNKMTKEVDAFQNLSRRMSDYWHYGLMHETNPDRGYSYVRLYQMITMIQTYYADCELDHRIHGALENNRSNADLIAQIRHAPGITHRKLCEVLAATSDDLQRKLRTLEKEGYVTGQRSGEERFYVLSNAGDTLYDYLTMRTQKHWVDQWSNERIIILCFTLLSLKQHGNKAMNVQDVESLIASFDEKIIKNLFNSIIMRAKKKKTQSVRQLQAKQPDIYIEEYVTEKTLYLQLFENVSQ